MELENFNEKKSNKNYHPIKKPSKSKSKYNIKK